MTLEEQANLLAQNVAGWETRSLERIGKRIKKYGRLNAVDLAQIDNIAVAKGELAEITKDLAKVTGKNIAEVERMYSDAIAKQHAKYEPVYDFRGKPFIPFEENKRLQQLVKSVARSTGGEMINLSRTSAMRLMNGSGNIVSMQQGIYDALDKATVSISAGGESFYTAMRDTIANLGGSGIMVSYDSGVTRQITSVVRQTLLYGTKQISDEYFKQVGEEIGADGVEVDYHANPRPSHVFLQGRQFHNGNTVKIDGVTYQGTDEVDPTSTEGQTPNEALGDYGCRHKTTPIICGVNEPAYDPKELQALKERDAAPITIDGKTKTGYEWSQTMRRLESETRKEKLNRDVAKASGAKDLEKASTAKIKAYREKYNQIAEAAGIKAQPKRMSITKGR